MKKSYKLAESARASMFKINPATDCEEAWMILVEQNEKGMFMFDTDEVASFILSPTESSVSYLEPEDAHEDSLRHDLPEKPEEPMSQILLEDPPTEIVITSQNVPEFNPCACCKQSVSPLIKSVYTGNYSCPTCFRTMRPNGQPLNP